MHVRNALPGHSFRGFATGIFFICGTSGWVHALDATAPAKPRFVLVDRMEPNEPADNCHHVFTPAALTASAVDGIFWVTENPNGTHADSKMLGTSVRILTPETGSYRVYAEDRRGGKKIVITNVVEIQFTATTVTAAVVVPGEKAKPPASTPAGSTPAVSIPAGGSSVGSAPAGGTPAEKVKPATDVKAELVGTWRFSSEKDGWSARRTFKPNGTLIEYTAVGKTSTARWEVVGDKIKLHHARGGTDEMSLPLNPKGTKVVDWKKKELSAVKE
jgi:hypothetical protein